MTTGVLVLHGFTGNPSSMRGFAEAMAGAGFHVEMPRLPGHGTTVEDMLTTGWADWSAEVEAAYTRLAERAERIVVAGLSMGGALTLWLGLVHPEIAGLVCVNPATHRAARRRPPVPDRDAGRRHGRHARHRQRHRRPRGQRVGLRRACRWHRCCRSSVTGWPRSQDRYGELAMPLLLLTSREDHVVATTDSDYLAEHYGGPVDHRWLERSYHVATLDFDRDIIFLDAVEFAHRVTGS